MAKLRVWAWDNDLGIVYVEASTIREAYNLYGIFRGRGKTTFTVGIEMYNEADGEWEDWRVFLDGEEYTDGNIGEYLEKIGE